MITVDGYITKPLKYSAYACHLYEWLNRKAIEGSHKCPNKDLYFLKLFVAGDINKIKQV